MFPPFCPTHQKKKALKGPPKFKTHSFLLPLKFRENPPQPGKVRKPQTPGGKLKTTHTPLKKGKWEIPWPP